jgi:polysaccharide chain length determinant protein (PEP-CTERM system associated)
MKEQVKALLDLVQGAWLKRRWLVISLLLICPVGWGVVTLMPNQYTSEARVYADTRSILQPLLKGLAINTDPSQELSLIVKTLLSRTNLETIIRYSDAAATAKTSAEYEALITDLKNNIKIKSTGRENLFSISYVGSDPRYVKKIVQSALDVFVDSAVGQKRQDTNKAGQFIDDQIREYEIRLEESEADLAAFKQRYEGYTPGSEANYYAKIEQRKGILESTELEIKEKETQLFTAQERLDTEKAKAAKNQFGVETEFDSRLDLLEARLDDLLFRYTEKHPNVKETRRQIEDLRAQKQLSIANAASRGEILNSEQSQYLSVLIQQLRTEIASLQVRAQAQVAKILELENTVSNLPDVEAELTSLTRNYSITKEKYEELLSRREAALISQRVGAASDEITFRVIDPPQLPLKPSGPMRPLFLSAVLVVGLGAGMGASFLLSQISPVVTSAEQIYRETNIPVFGAVSITQNSGLRKKMKRKTMLFVLILFLIFCTFIGFVLLNIVPEWHATVLSGISQL